MCNVDKIIYQNYILNYDKVTCVTLTKINIYNINYDKVTCVTLTNKIIRIN